MEKMIIGHQAILDFFSKVIENGSLGQAYCFVGKEKVGKRFVADIIAQKILKVNDFKLFSHPDYVVVNQEISEKTDKTNKDINIEQIRNLIERLRQTSSLKDGYKVAIIDGAEKMNLGASNALLKTLEEPKSNTILFLLSSNEDKLLPTIKSRCQFIYFNPVSQSEIVSYLIVSGMEKDKAESFARQSRGLPGLIFEWQKNNNDKNKESERFNSLIGKPFYQKLKIVEELFGDKTDHILARNNLQKILDEWSCLIHDYLCDNYFLNKYSVYQNENKIKISEITLNKIYQEINKSKLFLNQNIHPKLLVENILLLLP